MKWRKLLELSTSSSPPGGRSRLGRPARRRAMFETLENRKLFAADLAEISTAELFGDTGVVVYDGSTDEQIAVRTFALSTVDLDESGEVFLDLTSLELDSELSEPEIRMMTMRGAAASGVEVELAKSEDVVELSDLETPIMTMAGAVDLSATSGMAEDFVDVEVTTLGDDVDASVDDSKVDVTEEGTVDATSIDAIVSDDDLIFYSLGSNPEADTTSLEEALPSEDVNGDGNVTPLDMLLVINALNSFGAAPISEISAASVQASEVSSWDINRDGFVTPLDALWVSNYFNYGMSFASLESSQDTFASSATLRIRNPDEAPTEDVSLEDVSLDQAPLIEDDNEEKQL